MLRSRWLSTFTIIGAILIVLGVVGLVMGPRFVYDPGQPVTGKEAWCYLIIGALMVLNGVLTPQPDQNAKDSIRTPAPRTSARPSSVASNGTGKPGHDVPVSADKNE